ncbi:SusC/RagA family TonB-linked outer membrane protein [Algoriphagus antarcticus]|uniref:TonB-linked SusC/RagA family outer membrane protein n=1 Tax=Algoriphagus antarcticus TaxID=238540 RepID=A0A3E0E3X5_9BACT|nr:SusC/RagA family TonB-linked outer membrane protein [Algoriphagus antarcticus]REG92875.1 TonB-linked SusC/RagA family outer membrane protein [Algoriphagus antarcticus]
MKKNIRRQLIMMSKKVLYAFVFQLIFCTVLLANSGNAQRKNIEQVRVDLSEENSSLLSIFNKIERQSGFEFTYNSSTVNLNQKVSVFSDKNTVYKILQDVSLSTGLRFIQVNDNIHVKERVTSAEVDVSIAIRENIAVSGMVTDSNGNGMPGVTIIIKGTTNGTVTDLDGKYQINAETTDVLVFSFIGYSNQEILVGNQTMIDVSLTEDATNLEEVIVIGYGEKSRKLMTESIGTVSSAEINKLPIASADQALQGRISGVQVTAVDGTPGSPVSVRVRGVGTVGNTQPLFVVDGVPVGNNSSGITNPLSTINPADIESISVLKDASASAVYGVRAANGVVLITTKRGKKGKPTVNLDSYYGVQNITRIPDYMNTNQWLGLTQDAYNAANTQNGLAPTDAAYQVLHPDLREGSPIRNRNNQLQWRDQALNLNAPIQNHNVSVSGGGDNYNYFVSGGFFGQEATVQKYDLKRYNFRANSDFRVNKRLKIGQTFTVSHQEIIRGINGGGDGFLLQSALTMPPFFNVFEDPSNPIPGNRYGYDGNNDLGGLTIGNQVGINQIVNNNDRLTRMLGSIYAELEIFKGLTYRSVYSMDFSNNRDDSWRPEYLVSEMGLNRPGNQFNDSRGEGYTQVFTNTLNYFKEIGKHSVDILAGMEYQKNRSTSLSVQGSDFISNSKDFYEVVKNGRGDPNIGGGAGQFAFVGYLGRISYNYDDKYLLTGTIRRDGTSTFSAEDNRRWGTFPSFSGAYRISQEDFFPKSGIISEMKIRGSWGQLGNSNTAAYPHIFRVSTTPDYGSGSTTIQAPVPINFVNKNVRWETVETIDFGVDLGLFNNKVDLLVTYYNRTTKDFLYSLPLPNSTGFGSTPVNLGRVSNKGIEIELGYSKTFSNGIQLSLNGNFTTVQNRLEELAPGIEEFTSDANYRTAVGQPIGYFFGYKTDGIYQTQAEIDAIFTGGFVDKNSPQNPRPGDVKFLDINGPGADGQQFSGEPDGVIDFNDRTYLGKTIPSYFYGLNIGLNYKAFDLSMLWQGVGDVQVFNQVRQDNLNLEGGGRNMLTEGLNRWTGPGTSNDVPRAINGDPNQNFRFSDKFVEDAGFVRLRNIQIGYTVPKTVLNKLEGFSSGRIYLAASNLLTITNYTGMDPEVLTFGSNSNQIGAGTDRGNMPQPRIFQMGIQLQF